MIQRIGDRRRIRSAELFLAPGGVAAFKAALCIASWSGAATTRTLQSTSSR